MEKNLKNMRKQLKDAGVFYTPIELAKKMATYIDFKPKRVYDPTVGQGNLLSIFDDDVEKYGQELFPEELEKAASRLINFHGYAGDTLTDDHFKDMKFDCIFSNPPYAVKWEPNDKDERFTQAGILPPAGKADFAFMLHIIHHLSDDGVAVVLHFPGTLYRGQREGKIRQWFVEQNYVERIVHVPADSGFTDTKIATCIWVLRKNKTTTDIIFEDLELKKERIVPFDEVKQQNFNLSVSTYVEKDKPREVIDIDSLNLKVRAADLKRVIDVLEWDLLICQMEEKEDEHINFIEAVKIAVSLYEKEYLENRRIEKEKEQCF